MKDSPEQISPLRRRMIEDMRMRKLYTKTQDTYVRVARDLPVVLSREEASRLIESASTLKHRTALRVACGAGARVSEVCALKVGEIDSQRMLLRIEKGKGHKDRYALLPPNPPRSSL
jgi:integrase